MNKKYVSGFLKGQFNLKMVAKELHNGLVDKGRQPLFPVSCS